MLGSESGSAQAAGLRSVHSNGLTASLINFVVGSDELTPEIVLTNDTKTRVYLLDVFNVAERGFLGSGQQTDFPRVVGLPTCGYDYTGCDHMWTDLGVFATLEPGNSLAVSLKYGGLKPFHSVDTFSFSLVVLARFASSPEDPSDIGSSTKAVFNFPFVPLNRR
jgi:hypothetical protein